MKCPYCNSEIDNNSKFCSNCGASFIDRQQRQNIPQINNANNGVYSQNTGAQQTVSPQNVQYGANQQYQNSYPNGNGQFQPYQQRPPFVMPPVQKKPKKKSGCLTAILIVVGAFVLLGIIGSALSGSDDDKVTNDSTVANEESTSTQNQEEIIDEELSEVEEAVKKDELDVSTALAEFETGEYAFVSLDDLSKYIVNMTGQKVYTVVPLDEVNDDSLQANIDDGFMFQTFRTDIDYTDYFEEGDEVAVFGTVGETEKLFGANWTDIVDSKVFAYGSEAEKYKKDSTDESLSEYLVVTDAVANASGNSNISEDEFKSLCESYPYDDILRNPDNYKKKYVVVSGTVDQTIEGTLDLYTSLFIVDSNGNKWGANITYSEGESRILEGDYVTLYGVLDGTRKTTTLLGEQVVMPYFDVEYRE